MATLRAQPQLTRKVSGVSRGSLYAPAVRASRSRSTRAVEVKALFQGGNKDRKFITREEEPEQYWASKGEKDGANPMKDPVAIIGVVAILFPFIFVLIAIGTGAIDTSVYR